MPENQKPPTNVLRSVGTQRNNKLQVMRAMAVNAAMLEFLSENRKEIIRRAREKLLAMGIQVSVEELESETSNPNEVLKR